MIHRSYIKENALMVWLTLLISRAQMEMNQMRYDTIQNFMAEFQDGRMFIIIKLSDNSYIRIMCDELTQLPDRALFDPPFIVPE